MKEKSCKISALVITLNEEDRIEKFLKSLSFADEIILVDSYSTDNTFALAKKQAKTTVLQRAFDNFSAQKNYAISQAKHDWIVFFDADEEITPHLTSEILAVLKNPQAAAFSVRRDFYFMGKKIKFSGLRDDTVVRVFDKRLCRYSDNLVHETLEVIGKTAVLKQRLPHFSYKGFDNYTQKLHQYSALQARMLYAKKKKPTLYHFLFRPWYRFWHQYLIRLGILDGKEGFILAYVSAFSVFKRYLNLWLLYRRIE